MISFPSTGFCVLAIIAAAFIHALVTVLRKPASPHFRQVRTLEIGILLSSAFSLVIASIVENTTLVAMIFIAGIFLFLMFTLIGLDLRTVR